MEIPCYCSVSAFTLLSHVGPITMKTGLRNLREPGEDLSGSSETVLLVV